MIQTKVRRRTSLIWGTLLALLLGVAMAFIVLAMPIRMLESVTTLTRLSKLMVQAEPPISPNDRTLLAVLAGIFTAGIGWVLVDWLLFGRAGMSTLIRTRDDDYEDEDEDAFRPTDPLDLVNPMAAAPAPRANDWAMPNGGDARRPLSARTDIGDPPMPMPGAVMQPPAIPGVNQALPPLGQILPGAGVSAPPLPSALPVPPIQQPDPGQAPSSAPTPAALWDVGGQQSWPPLDLNTPAPVATPAVPGLMPMPANAAPPSIAPAPAPAPAANMPSWLPAPGSRPDPETGTGMAQPFNDLPPGLSDAFPTPNVPPPLPIPEAPIPQPVMPQPDAAPTTILPEPPVFPADVLPAQPIAEPIGAAPQLEPVQPPVQQSPVQQSPAAVAPPPVPAWDAVAQPPAASRRPADPLLDPNRLEDLLVKLEQTVRNRRAAAAQAQQAAAPVIAPPPVAAPMPAQAPVAVPPAPPVPQAAPPIAAAPYPPQEPQRTAPPAAFAAPPPIAPLSAFPMQAPALAAQIPTPPPVAVPPLQPAPQPVAAPVEQPAPSPVQSIIPVAVQPTPVAIADGQREAMLEQPLHLTLDQLRNMVRR